jgi:hypothetical protein
MLTRAILKRVYEELPEDVAIDARQRFIDADGEFYMGGIAAKQATAIAELPDEILYNLQPAIIVAALKSAMRAYDLKASEVERLVAERNETVDVHATTDVTRLLQAIRDGVPVRLFVDEGE